MDSTKKGKRPLLLWSLGIASALFIAFFLCCQVLSISFPSNKIPSDAEGDFALMAEAWNAIHAHYVDRAAIKPKPLTQGAISGMVDALGDTGHSTFLSAQMIKEEEEFTSGVYKGVGAEVRMKGGHVVIVAPLDGSPAQKAGLQPGQMILDVDGQDVTGLSLLASSPGHKGGTPPHCRFQRRSYQRLKASSGEDPARRPARHRFRSPE
jgi:C-terminal processing protease CtpA/Prc